MATEVCQDRSTWHSVVSTYPAGIRRDKYVCNLIIRGLAYSFFYPDQREDLVLGRFSKLDPRGENFV